MKKIFYIILGLIPILFSCDDKETEGISEVTPVPHIELLGANPMVLIKGADFVDPGLYAEEYKSNGDTIKDLDFETINEIDVNVPGSYKLTYQVNNSLGVSFYINRGINVVDFTGYDVFEIATGMFDGIRVGPNTGGDIEVNKLVPGIYSISDLFGGYYEQYRGYGSRYSAPGIIIIDEDGSMRSELGYVEGWHSDVVASDISYDDATKNISYTVTIVEFSFSFDVELTLK